MKPTPTGSGLLGTGAWPSAMPLLAPMTDQRRFAVVILAAGQGTRMRSDTHKVLHPIASRPLLLHLLERSMRSARTSASSSPAKAATRSSGAQRPRRPRCPSGAATGHRPCCPAGRRRARWIRRAGPVLYGDTPFVEAETLRRMLDRLDGEGGPGVVVLASCPPTR